MGLKKTHKSLKNIQIAALSATEHIKSRHVGGRWALIKKFLRQQHEFDAAERIEWTESLWIGYVYGFPEISGFTIVKFLYCHAVTLLERLYYIWHLYTDMFTFVWAVRTTAYPAGKLNRYFGIKPKIDFSATPAKDINHIEMSHSEICRHYYIYLISLIPLHLSIQAR